MTASADLTQRWKRVRSFFEAPVLDERKWAKIPGIPADAFMIDIEDSVPDHLKDQARARVVEFVNQQDYFHGAMVIPRVNHLSTPWGRDDVVALAEAGVEQLMYPKAETVEDVVEVLELCRKYGSDPVLKVTIESARGVVEVERIAAMDEVVCISSGIGDLHVETGQPLYDDDGSLFFAHYYPKLRIVMACVAHGKAKIGFPQQPNIKDLDEYRRRAMIEKRLGYNGCSTFYPPYVPILHEVFSVSESELAEARETVALYEAAKARGDNAVQRSDGSALLIHQYKQAQALIERATE